ncbi:MAG: S8 family serine peptidase [Lachnospiraceae bacterium]
MRYIVTYNNNIALIEQVYKPDSYTIVGGKYVILYYDEPGSFLEINDASAYPKCYGPAQNDILEATGINTLRNVTGLNLYGNGVTVGIIDDGFDLQAGPLKNADGSSKFIWYYNQETRVDLNREEINRILKEEESFAAFSDKENTEHGTAMASIICGEPDEQGFTGVAPNVSVIGYALRRAEPELYEYYNIDPSAKAYSEADILEGLDYITRKAGADPLIILMPFETNLGSHTGRGILEEYSDWICEQLHRAVFVPAGNQAISKAHTSGRIFNGNDETGELKEIPFLVNEDRVNTFINIVMSAGTKPVIMLESPTGELKRVSGINSRLNFVFEGSVIEVKINLYDSRSEKCMVYVRGNNLTKGIWKVYLQAENVGREVEYECYLPILSFSGGRLEFLSPVSENTVTSPGDARLASTVGSYDNITGKIYPPSGKDTLDVKPEYCAPGVDVSVYNTITGSILPASGTSISAAVAAGAGALTLQWAVVMENGPYITGAALKQFLITGCIPMSARVPEGQWGYGALNLYMSFESLRD